MTLQWDNLGGKIKLHNLQISMQANNNPPMCASLRMGGKQIHRVA